MALTKLTKGRARWQTFKLKLAKAVSRSLYEKLLDQGISVLDFGADRLGQQDSSEAFQLAINMGRKVIVPKGKYLIKKPLDITNKSAGSFYLTGEMWAMGGSGSTLIGDTGDIVIDTTGTQHFRACDLNIISGGENPSTGGILQARSITSQYAQFHTYERVYIDLKSNVDANNGNGTFGIYNLASELCSYRDCHFRADTPLVATSQNRWNVKSPYQTIGSFTSASKVELTSSTCVSYAPTGKGNCLFISGVFGFEGNNVYMSGMSSLGGQQFAIKVDGFARRIKITGHIESCKQMVEMPSQVLGASFELTGLIKDLPPVSIGESSFNTVSDIELDINSVNSSEEQTAPCIISGYGTSQILGLTIKGMTPEKIPTSNINANNIKGLYRVYRTTGVECDRLIDPVSTSGIGLGRLDDKDAMPRSVFVRKNEDNLFYKKGNGTVVRITS